MGMQLNTGDTGRAVSPAADGSLYSKIFGSGCYVLSGGNELKAEIQSNNLIKIYDGDLIMQGRHSYIPASDSDNVTINNGSQGMNRKDLIVARYTKDSTGVEDVTLQVVQGMATSGAATAPGYTDGDILKGATAKDFPLYEVSLTGINITEVKKLFKVLGTNEELTERLAELNGKSGILTPADQNNPITEYQLYKMGKMVVFNVTNYKKGQGAVNGRVIGTIQEGFLPPHTIAISFGTSGIDQFDSSGNPGSRIFVNDAGVVTLCCNKNTGNYISFTACWVTD